MDAYVARIDVDEVAARAVLHVDGQMSVVEGRHHGLDQGRELLVGDLAGLGQGVQFHELGVVGLKDLVPVQALFRLIVPDGIVGIERFPEELELIAETGVCA